MALTQCKYCEHDNPPDSKYCNACGAILTLAPCPHCGAVNGATATTCYQCRGSLQESSKDALVPALPAAAISDEFLAPASFTTLAAPESGLLSAMTKDNPTTTDATSRAERLASLLAARELTVSTSNDKDSVFWLQPLLRQPSLAIVGTVVVVMIAFVGYYAYRHDSLVSLPPSSAANTEAKGRSGPVQPASTPGPAATPTVPVTATPTSAVSPCTERVAALGLCTPKPVPKKNQAEAAAAVPAAIARPQTNNGGEPCTEALAALGLCTPKSK